jgi:hypothetical protein
MPDLLSNVDQFPSSADRLSQHCSVWQVPVTDVVASDTW